MDPLLRKYLWLVDLLVVVVCAVFAARATASAIESSYLLDFGPVHAPVRALPPPPKVYGKETDEILRRNIFCSGCPPILTSDEPDGGVTEESGAPQKSTLALKLMAIMYAPPPHAAWSTAIVRDLDSKGIGPYGVGGSIRDGVVVDSIEEIRIYVRTGGHLEYIDLLDKAPPPASKTAAAGVSAPVAGMEAEIAKGLKKIGENRYEIQRATLDGVLGNLSELSRSARIVPELKDGRPAGFRLYSVRPDGPFALIGLQNGDVVQAINGIEMSSPDQALGAYTKLKTASHLSVSLERNGTKTTMDYNIR